jgi:hypothetical protein
VADRKLAGSAQARGADGFLQHGAIPIRYDAAENRRLLGAPERARTACAPFLADPDAADRFARLFFAALAEGSGLALLPDPEPPPSRTNSKRRRATWTPLRAPAVAPGDGQAGDTPVSYPAITG